MYKALAFIFMLSSFISFSQNDSLKIKLMSYTEENLNELLKPSKIIVARKSCFNRKIKLIGEINSGGQVFKQKIKVYPSGFKKEKIKIYSVYAESQLTLYVVRHNNQIFYIRKNNYNYYGNNKLMSKEILADKKTYFKKEIHK